MGETATRMSQRDRLLAVLAGEQPDRIPFIDRLEVWYDARTRTGTLPEEFRDLTLTEIHRAVGMGQLEFVRPVGFRLRGVELRVTFNGESYFTEHEPVVFHYPGFRDIVQRDKPGLTRFELVTPVGTVAGEEQMLQETIDCGEEPYLREHLIKEDDDFRVAHWILDHMELVPRFEEFRELDAGFGEVGFAIAGIQQIPFQQVLLEYLGEMSTFYALYDNPKAVKALIDHAHERLLDTLDCLADLDTPYVELLDNLTAHMANPKLFREWCLPHYQQYAEILHGQGKRMGSHTDGDLKPLLDLIAESGLDVCESFSPAPLSSTTFDEVWDAWGGREWPIVWGVIPSPLLEARVPEQELHAFVEHVLERVGDGRVILGVSDMVMGHNEIDRVRWIADRVEEHERGLR